MAQGSILVRSPAAACLPSSLLSSSRQLSGCLPLSLFFPSHLLHLVASVCFPRGLCLVCLTVTPKFPGSGNPLPGFSASVAPSGSHVGEPGSQESRTPPPRYPPANPITLPSLAPSRWSISHQLCSPCPHPRHLPPAPLVHLTGL